MAIFPLFYQLSRQEKSPNLAGRDQMLACSFDECAGRCRIWRTTLTLFPHPILADQQQSRPGYRSQFRKKSIPIASAADNK